MEAASGLLGQGHQPSVAEAAAADVHPATAYRYLPTSQSLVAAAALDVVSPDLDRRPPRATSPAVVDPDDAFGLMDAGVGTLAALMLEEQAALHNMVRVTVDGWFAERERPDAVRQTRRSGWIDHALAPVEASLSPGQLRRLRFALALVMGAQALIVTRDVWRLEPEEATEVMRFAAATLIRGALDARAGPSLSRGRRPGAGEKAP